MEQKKNMDFQIWPTYTTSNKENVACANICKR